MCIRDRDKRATKWYYNVWSNSSNTTAKTKTTTTKTTTIQKVMAKIGYTQKPDGQNRVPPSTLVPGRHLIGQRPPRPSGRFSNGSTRFWILTPPSATRFQSHLPDYGRAICALFIFLIAKKIRQLKNCIIIAPPQHDTCLLYTSPSPRD